MKAQIKVDNNTLSKVKEEIKKTKQTIGGYYDLAAEQSLNKDASKEFSRNDLVLFGQYLLSDERKKNIKKGTGYKNFKSAALLEVYHADIENFLATKK